MKSKVVALRSVNRCYYHLKKLLGLEITAPLQWILITMHR